MSQHQIQLFWQRNTSDFEYKTYTRNHTWKFKNGVTIQASAAPGFRGDANAIDPEEAYVASLSSCHMLTFLAICAKEKIIVNSYEDEAVGYLERNESKKYVITKVILKPKVIFDEGMNVSQEKLEELHHISHQECFIANSVKTKIETIID